MDKNKQPGIKIDRMILEAVNFQVNPSFVPQASDGINVDMQVNVQKNLIKLERKLRLGLEIKLFEKYDNPPFRLTVLVAGYFSVDNDAELENLEEFSNIQGPALIFPFVREIIANLSMRTGLQPLILPPTNIWHLLGQSQSMPDKKQKSKQQITSKSRK